MIIALLTATKHTVVTAQTVFEQVVSTVKERA